MIGADLKKYGWMLAGALLLMWPAMVNGFPFVYSDTSTYISSGFELKTPIDRPIAYGLFMRLTSINGLSIWGIVFFQSLIVACLLHALVSRCFTHARLYLPLVIFLSLFSSLPWICCLLLPDIFTPVLVLSAVIILFDNEKKNRFFMHFIFLLACSMHLSHFLFSILLLLIGYLFRKKILPNSNTKRNWRFAILFLLTGFALIPGLSALSKSKHVFFFGAMVEHGIVKEFLDETAETITISCVYTKTRCQQGLTNLYGTKKVLFIKLEDGREPKKSLMRSYFQPLPGPNTFGCISKHR